jgi:hypothetical protein
MAKASGARGCVLGAMLVLGCNSELPPVSHIEVTEIFMVRHEVELGPLDPDRVGPQIAGPQMAIAEALPGDRVDFEAVVVDTEGWALPEDEIETLWVQCGSRSCDSPYQAIPFASYVYDVRCDEHPSYDLSSLCLLGAGTGSFEFEVPELSSYGLLYSFELTGKLVGPRVHFYVVVAWNGKSAQACWDARRGDRADLDDCGFIYHDLALGPIWWLFDYAASRGIDPPLDPSTFPEVVLLQPANRIPRPPSLTITVDDQAPVGGIPPLDPIPVEAGARVGITLTFDALSQLFQSGFEPISSTVTDTFIVVPEPLYSRTATSGAITSSLADNVPPGLHEFHYEVDPDAQPGISRVLIGYRDEGGGRDYVGVEFEVQ